MPARVVIIGGGIAGLCAARALGGTNDAIVLEQHERLGGRVRTIRDDEKRLLYEAGPWRVLDTHRRMIRLVRALGCHLDRIGKPTTITAAVPAKPGIVSVFASWLMSGLSVVGAFRRDLLSGYLGSADAVSEHTYPTAYRVIREGFDGLVERLADGVAARTGCRVLDVVRVAGGYRIMIRRRTGHNSFVDETTRAERVILACPPDAWRRWSVFVDLEPLASCVVARPLHRLYARTTVMDPSFFYVKDESVLNQKIASSYGNQWFQASYTSGRLARFWAEVFLAYPSWCYTAVRRVFTGVTELRSHYWEKAVHQWRNRPLASLAIHPQPLRLPGLFVVGEAFSDRQGWTEGALATVEELVARWDERIEPMTRVPRDSVIYRGMVIGIRDWLDRHPGGREPLLNHLGEDITDLWDGIHTSERARAELVRRCVGWV